MKVLLVNGSPHERGCTYTGLSEVAGKLEEEGVETELFWIGTGDIPGCRGCGACRKGRRCVIEDSVNDIGDRLDEFDGIVFGSPVYYSGPDGQLCSWMDRLFYSNQKRMYGKVAAAVVNCRRGGDSAALQRMNQYFLMCNMVVPGSQYWNQIHGFTPEDVMKDEEGLQTMRTLAQNIAWVLKCMEAGRKAGISMPVYEKWTPTHFIR